MGGSCLRGSRQVGLMAVEALPEGSPLSEDPSLPSVLCSWCAVCQRLCPVPPAPTLWCGSGQATTTSPAPGCPPFRARAKPVFLALCWHPATAQMPAQPCCHLCPRALQMSHPRWASRVATDQGECTGGLGVGTPGAVGGLGRRREAAPWGRHLWGADPWPLWLMGP